MKRVRILLLLPATACARERHVAERQFNDNVACAPRAMQLGFRASYREIDFPAEAR